MNEYRYKLERYRGMKTRHQCPQCRKPKKFTRYIDITTNEYLPYEYGKCERLDNCAYHLSPYKTGYSKQKWLEEKGNEDWKKVHQILPIKSKPKPVYIPFDIFRKSLIPEAYERNNFIIYLDRILGTQRTQKLLNTFYIGSCNYWQGATVFWLINETNKICGGQVILYGNDGHTHKEPRADGTVKRYNGWIHTALEASYKKKQQPIPKWLNNYSAQEGNKSPCLFGLPQLRNEPNTKPIAIVEAAKTAIIATAYLPQYIWLAVGGLSYLNESRLSSIKGRNITLFPDKGGFERWSKKAKELYHVGNFTVSDLLERKGKEGTDLADYLTQYSVNDF